MALPPPSPIEMRSHGGWRLLLRRSRDAACANRMPLCLSVLAGCVAAAGPYLLVAMGLALLGLLRDITVLSNWIGALGLVLLPLLIALPLVLAGMLGIVLPLSVLLQSKGWRGGCALAALSTLAGALLTGLLVAMLPVHDAYWLMGLGALSGGVTALCWWCMLAVRARDRRYG